MTWPWVMHIPHRQHHVARYGVKRHSRSGADNESRTRGLGHGVAALFQLSYIRKICKTDLRPVSRSSCSNLLKSICRCRQRDPAIAGLRRCASRGSKQKTKRPGSFRNPGLCEQSLEGARLGAALSRMHLVLGPIKLLMARGLTQMQSTHATAKRAAHRLDRPSAHERDQPHQGSVACDDARGFHDEAFEEKWCSMSRGSGL